MPKTNSYKILAKFEESQTCNLCLTNRVDDFNLGKIYKLADIIVHYFCLLLASQVQQNGKDKQGILGFFPKDIKKEILRGSDITCCYCKKKGATVICASKRCIKSFHLTCGLDKGSMHQFFDAFKSYCGLHRPKQKIPVSVRKSTSDLCVICACAIDLRSQNTYLWPSCCKAFSFLHRDCVQKLASSAGYYFKCPLCNNTRNFQGAMRFYGIYIPEQEASWETEPNAYEDLLVRHQKCEADICCCPRGRMYSKKNSYWHLEVCSTCGGSGIHLKCSNTWKQQEGYNLDWNCNVCNGVVHTYCGDNTVQKISNIEDIIPDSPEINVVDSDSEDQCILTPQSSSNIPEVITIDSDSEDVDVVSNDLRRERKRRISLQANVSSSKRARSSYELLEEIETLKLSAAQMGGIYENNRTCDIRRLNQLAKNGQMKSVKNSQVAVSSSIQNQLNEGEEDDYIIVNDLNLHPENVHSTECSSEDCVIVSKSTTTYSNVQGDAGVRSSEKTNPISSEHLLSTGTIYTDLNYLSNQNDVLERNCELRQPVKLLNSPKNTKNKNQGSGELERSFSVDSSLRGLAQTHPGVICSNSEKNKTAFCDKLGSSIPNNHLMLVCVLSPSKFADIRSDEHNSVNTSTFEPSESITDMKEKNYQNVLPSNQNSILSCDKVEQPKSLSIANNINSIKIDRTVNMSSDVHPLKSCDISAKKLNCDLINIGSCKQSSLCMQSSTGSQLFQSTLPVIPTSSISEPRQQSNIDSVPIDNHQSHASCLGNVVGSKMDMSCSYDQKPHCSPSNRSSFCVNDDDKVIPIGQPSSPEEVISVLDNSTSSITFNEPSPSNRLDFFILNGKHKAIETFENEVEGEQTLDLMNSDREDKLKALVPYIGPHASLFNPTDIQPGSSLLATKYLDTEKLNGDNLISPEIEKLSNNRHVSVGTDGSNVQFESSEYNSVIMSDIVEHNSDVKFQSEIYCLKSPSPKNNLPHTAPEENVFNGQQNHFHKSNINMNCPKSLKSLVSSFILSVFDNYDDHIELNSKLVLEGPKSERTSSASIRSNYIFDPFSKVINLSDPEDNKLVISETGNVSIGFKGFNETAELHWSNNSFTEDLGSLNNKFVPEKCKRPYNKKVKIVSEDKNVLYKWKKSNTHSNQPIKSRGRPKKRSRGRPKKPSRESPKKRSRGRPKKRSRGRPKKCSIGCPEKRPRGRPKKLKNDQICVSISSSPAQSTIGGYPSQNLLTDSFVLSTKYTTLTKKYDPKIFNCVVVLERLTVNQLHLYSEPRDVDDTIMGGRLPSKRKLCMKSVCEPKIRKRKLTPLSPPVSNYSGNSKKRRRKLTNILYDGALCLEESNDHSVLQNSIIKNMEGFDQNKVLMEDYNLYKTNHFVNKPIINPKTSLLLTELSSNELNKYKEQKTEELLSGRVMQSTGSMSLSYSRSTGEKCGLSEGNKRICWDAKHNLISDSVRNNSDDTYLKNKSNIFQPSGHGEEEINVNYKSCVQPEPSKIAAPYKTSDHDRELILEKITACELERNYLESSTDYFSSASNFQNQNLNLYPNFVLGKNTNLIDKFLCSPFSTGILKPFFSANLCPCSSSNLCLCPCFRNFVLNRKHYLMNKYFAISLSGRQKCLICHNSNDFSFSNFLFKYFLNRHCVQVMSKNENTIEGFLKQVGALYSLGCLRSFIVIISGNDVGPSPCNDDYFQKIANVIKSMPETYIIVSTSPYRTLECTGNKYNLSLKYFNNRLLNMARKYNLGCFDINSRKLYLNQKSSI